MVLSLPPAARTAACLCGLPQALWPGRRVTLPPANARQAPPIPNGALTATAVRLPCRRRGQWPAEGVNAVTAIVMDGAFLLLLAVLYAATHWLVCALARLGGVE